VKNYRDIYALLPQVGGHILVTSRDDTGWGEEQQIRVHEMALAEGQALVKKLCGQEGAEVDEMLKTLGYLPLAIAHAASYMKAKRASATAYLALYKGYQEKLGLLSEGKLLPGDEHEVIKTTWRLNRDELLKSHPQAAVLLEYCALLHSSDIPNYLLLIILSLLADKPQDIDLILLQKQFDDIKEGLSRYSFITIAQDYNSLSMHPLVQEFIRSEIPEDKFVSRLCSVARILTQASQEQNNSMTDIYRRQKLLPHLSAVSNAIDNRLVGKSEDSILLEPLKAALLMNAGDINSLLGSAHVAKEQYECGLKIKERLYGINHSELVVILHDLAVVYGKLGDAHHKKVLLERALAIKSQNDEVEDTQVVTIKESLASAYGDLGDTPQKKVLLEEALAIKKQRYGHEHIKLVSTLTNLAAACIKLGEGAKAKDLLKSSIAIQEKHDGLEHIYVAKTQVNLAAAHLASDEANEAKELLEKVLPILETYYGKRHVEITAAVGNLAHDILPEREYC